jgi:hypothetical protein
MQCNPGRQAQNKSSSKNAHVTHDNLGCDLKEVPPLLGPLLLCMCFGCLQAAISYCVGLVRGRVGLARLRLCMDIRASVSRCHIRWLGLRAAQRVLSRCVSQQAM